MRLISLKRNILVHKYLHTSKKDEMSVQQSQRGLKSETKPGTPMVSHTVGPSWISNLIVLSSTISFEEHIHNQKYYIQNKMYKWATSCNYVCIWQFYSPMCGLSSSSNTSLVISHQLCPTGAGNQNLKIL